jgi:hypothetical protein
MFLNVQGAAQAVGAEHAAFHDAKRTRACPGHALQESPKVNSIMVMVVQDLVCDFDLAGFVMFLFAHCVGPPRRVTIANRLDSGFIPVIGDHCLRKPPRVGRTFLPTLGIESCRAG